jgi:hypothetical protein
MTKHAEPLPTEPDKPAHPIADRPDRPGTPTHPIADPPRGDRPKADHTLPTPEPPIIEAYPDTGKGLQIVNLIGLLAEPTLYRVGKPIPQDIAVDGNIFNLSDRAAGTYTFRHR